MKETPRSKPPPKMCNKLILPLLLLVTITITISSLLPQALARPFVVILTQDDFEHTTAFDGASSSSTEWDDFGYSNNKTQLQLDPGSWQPVFEPFSCSPPSHPEEALEEVNYYSSLRKLFSAVTSKDTFLMDDAASEIEEAAIQGYPHAQSVLAFLYGSGQLRNKSEAKAFLYHHFASQGGNMQSKMALAYLYYRQNMHGKAVKLYAELAEAALSSFLTSIDPLIEPVRIHSGTEKNTEGLREPRDDTHYFHLIKDQAQRGVSEMMYEIGTLYYFGLRGVGRDHVKALSWFLKAAEKGEPRSMELLGEIYARGAGDEQNYEKALEWFTRASNQQHVSAYNGMGYLYIKGFGMEMKNYTKAKEYFEKAAENEEAGGHYNLGVLYLKGIGGKKDTRIACELFIKAANAGQPKAFFQLAKMFHTGMGLRKNLGIATALYKLVAEWGPWSSLSKWALESYLKGEVGKSFLLYSRMAELGYEVAQSNAAWILDKYGDRSICMGGSGVCTDTERHQHAHALWCQSSEQGNGHAALLIGDAYYYGRGTERDYEHAADSYMRARLQSNARAMFILGYMHEHGHGLPLDLHLAKRYYDEVRENEPATLDHLVVWSKCIKFFRIKLIDSIAAWIRAVEYDTYTAMLIAYTVCIVIYYAGTDISHMIHWCFFSFLAMIHGLFSSFLAMIHRL